EPNAVLVVLPGPAIPFQGCRYYQHVAIDLAAGAGLVWGDIWLAGRYARGAASEQFQFATLIQDLSIQREGQLIFRDRFCWSGPGARDTARWHFGDALACGSLFVTGVLDEQLLPRSTLRESGSGATAWGDTCTRWCGPSEAVTACVVNTALRAAARLSSQR